MEKVPPAFPAAGTLALPRRPVMPAPGENGRSCKGNPAG